MARGMRLGRARGLAGALGLMMLAATPASAGCVLGDMADFPVSMSGLRPMVPVKINGVDETFLLDSGAFASMINPATVDELKLPHLPLRFGFNVTGVGGADYGAFATRVSNLTLSRSTLKDVIFLVTVGAGDGAGIIGQNVLGVGDVEYDLANGQVRLFKPKDCPGDSVAYWAKGPSIGELPIQWMDSANSHTLGDAYINGVKIKVVFDTGAAGSVLTKAAAERAGIEVDSPTVRFVGTSHGIGPRASRTWIADVASFKIGGEEIKNGKLRIADFSLEDIGGDMLLGADFFLSHRVYVSNARRKLYFTYNGGPVFNLGQTVLVQDGAGAAPKAAVEDLGEEPKDADGYARRGEAFAARREFERAIADLGKAIDLAPSEPKYAYRRALLRLENRQPALAMSDLDQTLKLDPRNIDALLLRARLRLQEKDLTGAADLDSAAALAPKEADLRLVLADLYVAADRFDASIAQSDLWIASHDGDGRMAEALAGRCRARALLGQELSKAQDDCNRALRLTPKAAGPLQVRGFLRARMGDNDGAIADETAVLSANPRNALSLYARGLAQRRKGLTAQGDADVAAALAINPKVADLAKRWGLEG